MTFFKPLTLFFRAAFVLALAFILTACGQIDYQPFQEPGVYVIENAATTSEISSFSVESEGFGTGIASFYTDANGERVRLTTPIPRAPMYTIKTYSDGRKTQISLTLLSQNAEERVRYKVRCHTARLILSKSNVVEPVNMGVANSKFTRSPGQFFTGVCNADTVEIDGPEAIGGVDMSFEAKGSIGDTIELKLPDIEIQEGRVILGRVVKLQARRVKEEFSIR